MGESSLSAGGVDPRRIAEQARRSLELSRRAAVLAREAADISAEMAANLERFALWGTPASNARVQVAVAYRRSEACQRTAAGLHENYMRQLERWLTRQNPRRELRPVFMSSVAAVTGWRGAVLTLFIHDGEEALVAASNPTVRAAHELEVSLAEGPSWEAARHQTLAVARGPEVERRWPRYGAAVRDLGVGSVAAAPIHLGYGDSGSLTLIDPSSAPVPGVGDLGEVADALAAVLQTSDSSPVEGGGSLGLQVFEPDDFQPSLHAAAGVLHERCGYDMAAAVALIRAHAFAEDRPVAEVADQVIREGWLP